MSYNPKTNWQDSEIVHATDMNRIEQGISDADVGLGNMQAEVTAHKADGTQHAKTARFVVGTSIAGWTSADCDYLCDGTADQAEINAAIAALPVTGGEIIILDGTYNITAKIDMNKSNVSIRGNGNATILKRMWNSTTTEGVIHLEDISGCKIENLKIDGNNADYTSLYNLGVRLNSSSNNIITSNTCNNSNAAISLNSSSNNIITSNTCNSNDGLGVGISLTSSSSNNLITGNICNNNSIDGIYLDSSSNNAITDNTCNNNSSTAIRLLQSSDNTITGNTCNSNGSAIVLFSSSNNTITGNTCNNSSSTISQVSSGIRLGSSSSNNTITGNTCIRGAGLTTDYTQNQYTIYLMGVNNNYNLISNNNCMGKAVTSEGGTGNTLVNNKFDALTKSVMTVSVNSFDIPLSKEGTIDCDYVLNSTGNSLTQDTAGIVIGPGVSKVKVSCNFWINAKGENRVWVKLKHKKETVFDTIGDVISTDKSGFVTGSISPVLVDVMQGDCFFLSYANAVSGLALNSASGNAHATNLTVEVVE